MGTQKGKQATKGQKQIVEENKSTLNFYFYVIIFSNIGYLLPTYYIFWDSFTLLYMVIYLGAVVVHCSSYQVMLRMAKATYAAPGQLVDGGIDLNMESGMAEHLKDIILLTATVEVLSLISSYFWLVWLLIPIRALYLLWVNILGPWFFAPSPEEEVSEKKQKKMERKMRRMQ